MHYMSSGKLQNIKENDLRKICAHSSKNCFMYKRHRMYMYGVLVFEDYMGDSVMFFFGGGGFRM